jgi:predicted alpha-1,6-mannanase (GH76 family)
MKICFCRANCHVDSARWLFLAILLVLGIVCPAEAQWTAADAQTAFSDYNNAFYFNPSDDNYDYRGQQGSTSTSGFWVGAEEIELAIDAYNQNPTAANATIINQLCNGFVAQFGSNWSSDSFDDDLMWATIAFVRAYKATSNSTWLNNAETNFSVVWNRGYDTTFGGGIWWNAAQANTPSGYKNSAANWTFVIAGNLLYQASGDSTYLSEASTIFSWASSNLYNASTGEVYDGVNSSGIQNSHYSYNFGVAVGADYFENRWSDATNVANYLMNNLSSGTVGGYNILPNYGQGGTDGGGFNGIALRWIGYAYTHGALSNSNILTWAQTNVGLAWAQQNAAGLSWNDWMAATADSGLYSWDCSDTVVGMLDIPVTPASTADYSLTSSPSMLTLAPGSDGSSKIILTPSNGFNGTVALTATPIGSPAGISATLSESSISGSGSATLTVSTTSATQGGNYVIAVTSTSGSITHTAYVKVGLPYFSLSIASNSLYLDQSGTVSRTVTITPENGFHGQVQFTALSGLPEGVGAWFQPKSASTGTTLKFVARDDAATTVGTSLSVIGTSGTLAQKVSAGNLVVSAAAEDCGTGVSVDLSSAYNETGIYPTGSTYSKSAGLDGVGYSYSSNLLSNARDLNGTLFKFGPAGTPDAIYGAGQKIPLPSGQYTALQLLATGVNGEQPAQTVVVTYTDGTTSQFTQGFSDWYSSSNNANEEEAAAMTFRNYADGTQNNAQINLYRYTFLLNSDKSVQSITLPNNRNVVVLAATLTRHDFGDQVNLSSLLNVSGINTDGTNFASNGGLDGGGAAYSANLLGNQAGASNLVINGVNFSLYPPNSNNAIYGTGQAIPLPVGHFSSLQILGTGVAGDQTSQIITIAYTDGTTRTFTQNFSDWYTPQGYPREFEAQTMAYRDQSDGSKDSQTYNLYHYKLPLDKEKTVQSIVLPSNRHVVVLGITLTREFLGVRGACGYWTTGSKP